MESNLQFHGELKTKHRRNLFHIRLPFGLGRFWFSRDKGEAVIGGREFFISELIADVRHADGTVDRHYLGSGLVTNAGVNLMGADWTSASAVLKLMKWHDSGTGTTAAAVTDTTLQTATGIARVSGSQSNVNNVYTTSATITYNAGFAVTEWGLFSANSAGTMWDHRVFSAINVSNTDQITFTYNLTIASGG